MRSRPAGRTSPALWIVTALVVWANGALAQSVETPDALSTPAPTENGAVDPAPAAETPSDAAPDTEPTEEALANPSSETDEKGAQDAMAERPVGYGLSLGYGSGIAARGRQKGRDVADVQILTLAAQVRLPVWTAGDGTRWFHGRLEGLFEAQLMLNFEPTTGAGGGVLGGLRYRFRPDARLQPYVEGLIGLGGMGFDLNSQDNGFQFFIQAGGGARWRLREDWFLVGSFRWQHISNAQTHLPNTGIDTLGVVAGIELRL